MTMPCDDIDAGSTLIVPNPDCLVITAGKNPWKFVMEEDSSNIINVTCQYEVASFLLVVPDSDITIITSRDKERKMQMKVNPSYWSVMFLYYWRSTSNLAIRIFIL